MIRLEFPKKKEKAAREVIAGLISKNDIQIGAGKVLRIAITKYSSDTDRSEYSVIHTVRG